jgi:hypothetical protein
MHYDASCWDTNPSPNICFMLAIVYLDYLDLKFHIEKIIHVSASQKRSDDSALLEASLSLLSAAISSSRHLSRNSGAYTDYVWNVRQSLDPSPPAGRLTFSAANSPTSWFSCIQLTRSISYYSTDFQVPRYSLSPLRGVLSWVKILCIPCRGQSCFGSSVRLPQISSLYLNPTMGITHTASREVNSY